MGQNSETRCAGRYHSRLQAGSSDLEKSVFRKKVPETRLKSLCVVQMRVCKHETKLAYYVGLGA